MVYTFISADVMFLICNSRMNIYLRNANKSNFNILKIKSYNGIIIYTQISQPGEMAYDVQWNARAIKTAVPDSVDFQTITFLDNLWPSHFISWLGSLCFSGGSKHTEMGINDLPPIKFVRSI